MKKLRTHLENHLSVDELRQRYETSGSGPELYRDEVESRRWHALWLLALGHGLTAAANVAFLSERTIRKVVDRYNADGPAGVDDRRSRNRGYPRLLTAAQQAELRQLLCGPPPRGKRWTSLMIAEWMGAQLNREVGKGQAFTTTKQLGWSHTWDLGRPPVSADGPPPGSAGADTADR